MHITLMRHGRPLLASSPWIPPRDMGRWIAQYDAAEVEPAGIPAASIAAAGACTVIFASTLPRALASARALDHAAPRTDALFCEAPLPFPLWRFPRLPPAAWVVLFRLAWLGGYARGADAYAVVALRAKAASAGLVAAAADGPVLLIGHGILNRMIARELRRAGWTTSTRQRSGHWAATGFQSPPGPLSDSGQR